MNHFKTRFPKKAMAGLALALSLCFMAGTASAVEFDVKGTTVTLGGYLKLLANYDLNGTLNNNTNHPTDGDMVNAYDTPLNGTTYADESDFSMTARESRIFVKTSTQTDIGIVSTYFEGDANGDVGGSGTWSNSRTFRLRHAAGTVKFGNNEVMAGQTWTTFMDFAAAVPVMDLAGDPGQPFVRQPQVRFTYNIAKGHFWSFSAENPDRGYTGVANAWFKNMETKHTETLPDVVMKYFWSQGPNFHLSPKLLVRRFELDNKSTMAWAASLTSHLGFGKGHKIYLGLTYGDGIGRYGGLGLNAGAGLSDAGTIETIKFKSVNTGITIALKDNLDWTTGCGYSENDDDAYTKGVLTGSANKDAFSWHTMLAWKITQSLEYAISYSGYRQTVMDGREGDMGRFQSYIKYSF